MLLICSYCKQDVEVDFPDQVKVVCPPDIDTAIRLSRVEDVKEVVCKCGHINRYRQPYFTYNFSIVLQT